MDEQRKRVYSFRQSLLEGAPPKDMILEMIDSQIKDTAKRFLAEDYGTASFAEWVSQQLGIDVTARDVKGATFEDAADIVKSRAERQLYETIREAMEENLPSDADPSDWTWLALANWANTRFELSLKEKDLRKYAHQDGEEFQFGREDLEEFLHEKASASIEKYDLNPAKEFLEPDWGRKSLAGWARHKFGLAIDVQSWAGLDNTQIVRQLQAQAREHYATKEAELPVRIAITRFLADRSQHMPPRYDREGLAAWASERFHTVIEADEIRPMLRPEIETLLLKLGREHYQGAKLSDELDHQLELAYPSAVGKDRSGTLTDGVAIESLASWANKELGLETSASNLEQKTREEVRAVLENALDAKHRPEMREMEKVLLLQILDSSWMEHLRAMDHLRSSIGLQGYAQIDPKVEYKREGMKIFGEMWSGIADRATDLIFRVEHFDPEFLSYLGSQWKLDRAQTIHQAADSQLAGVGATGNIRHAQDAAIAGSQQSTEKKREPVRNVGKKVGRNDPCPCGSGKKFKACCMRKQSTVDPF
jgi:preprotein translocase subunit SecA